MATLNGRSDPKDCESVVNGENQQGDEEKCQDAVDSGLMKERRCTRLVVKDNCDHQRIQATARKAWGGCPRY